MFQFRPTWDIKDEETMEKNFYKVLYHCFKILTLLSPHTEGGGGFQLCFPI